MSFNTFKTFISFDTYKTEVYFIVYKRLIEEYANGFIHEAENNGAAELLAQFKAGNTPATAADNLINDWA